MGCPSWEGLLGRWSSPTEGCCGPTVHRFCPSPEGGTFTESPWREAMLYFLSVSSSYKPTAGKVTFGPLPRPDSEDTCSPVSRGLARGWDGVRDGLGCAEVA